MSELPFGIDISSYQTSQDGKQKPDFAKINSTCKFVGVRAGISWGYIDKWFRNSWDQLEIPRLAYHVVYPGENANRQMDHFLNIVRPKATDRLVLDMELDHGYSKQVITDNFLLCLENIRSGTGRYPVIYSRANWINQHLDVSRLPKLDWWLATYKKKLPYPQYTPERASPPILPKGITQWLIHQTAEAANGAAVGVASHYVDIDRWNTANQEIEAFFGLEEVTPIEPPDNPEPPITSPEQEAIVITVPPNRLRTRYTPAGIERPEKDWLQSGQKVTIYEEVPDWSKVGLNRWSATKYLQKIMNLPLFKVQLWSQKDPRWAKDRMGSSNITLEQEGCLVTIVSIHLNFLGIDTDPKRYNAALTKLHGYQSPNFMYWQMPAIMWPNQIAMKEYQWFNNGTGWEPLAESIVASGRPVLAQVRSTPMQHWVLLLGKLNNLWYCLDPLYGTVSALTDRYNKVFRLASYTRR